MSRHTQGSLAIVGAIGAGIFLVAFVALMILGEYGFSAAAFLALLVALLASIVLYLGFGGSMPSGHAAHGSKSASSGAGASKTTGSAAASASATPASSGAGATSTTTSTRSSDGSAASSSTSGSSSDAGAGSSAGAGASAMPAGRGATTAPLPDIDSSVGGPTSSSSVSEPEPTPEPRPEPEPTPEPVAEPEPAIGAGADSTPDYDGDGVREGENEGVRPAGLDGPRDGKADDLKQIKGVGPKMEQLCNSLGFWHFDQVASWTSDEVAWVDANLQGFKGRVSRDSWVEQAKVLAAGGETEFSKRVEDGDVY